MVQQKNKKEKEKDKELVILNRDEVISNLTNCKEIKRENELLKKFNSELVKENQFLFSLISNKLDLIISNTNPSPWSGRPRYK